MYFLPIMGAAALANLIAVTAFAAETRAVTALLLTAFLLVDCVEELPLIRDFLVMAIVDSPGV
jgi:hypothetical protein